MTDPILVPRDSLAGVRVGLSVSESADLSRLGLSAEHVRLVVVEIARAIILAGGTVVYGGRLRPAGFTEVIMQEVRRFGDERQALEIYVSHSEHEEIAAEDIRAIDRRLGSSGALRLLDASGGVVSISRRQQSPHTSLVPATALTAMRRTVTDRIHARIAVGGALSGYKGTEPGVLEEARLTLEAGKPLYVAGGYGGAAAAIAKALEFDDFVWAPEDFPVDASSAGVDDALKRLSSAFSASEPRDGLTKEERKILAVSHRPANIATLLVLGLSRLHGPNL
jgi:hypothetical protein